VKERRKKILQEGEKQPYSTACWTLSYYKSKGGDLLTGWGGGATLRKGKTVPGGGKGKTPMTVRTKDEKGKFICGERGRPPVRVMGERIPHKKGLLPKRQRFEDLKEKKGGGEKK